MSEHKNPSLDKLRRNLRERGNRLSPKLLRLARATFSDTDDVLSHQECTDALPEYVDAEIAGERLAENYSQVKRHLDLCDSCSEQYSELLEFTLAERAGEIPVPATVPEPDLAFLPPVSERPPVLAFPEFVKQKATAILTAIAPTELPDLLGVTEVFFKQVEILRGEFAFQRGATQAMGLGTGELTTPVATLAMGYSATRKLIQSLSPDQVDTLAEQDALGKRAEEQALLAGLELNVKSTMAKNIAKEFAALIAANPQALRALIEQEKH